MAMGMSGDNRSEQEVQEERVMNQTSIDEARRRASLGDFKRVPITRELLSDIRTPVETLKALMNVSEHCFMLESCEDARRWGRYTFLGYDPSMELSCKDHELTIRSGGDIHVTIGHPGDVIRKVIQDNRSPQIEGLPSLTGGLIGYFSYEYLQYGEPELRLAAEDNEHFDDVNLMLFDKLICYDHLKQKMLLIVNIRTADLETEYNKAVLLLEEMEKLVRFGKPKRIQKGHLKDPLRPKLSKDEYSKKVEEIKHYIHEGDIFQLVFSNPMQAAYEGSLFNTYRILRTTNPSPYMFYFSGIDVEVAGASPETLVKLENGILHTFPLAGTRPRGKTNEEDLALEAELLADEKELKETYARRVRGEIERMEQAG